MSTDEVKGLYATGASDVPELTLEDFHRAIEKLPPYRPPKLAFVATRAGWDYLLHYLAQRYGPGSVDRDFRMYMGVGVHIRETEAECRSLLRTLWSQGIDAQLLILDPEPKREASQ